MKNPASYTKKCLMCERNRRLATFHMYSVIPPIYSEICNDCKNGNVNKRFPLATKIRIRDTEPEVLQSFAQAWIHGKELDSMPQILSIRLRNTPTKYNVLFKLADDLDVIDEYNRDNEDDAHHKEVLRLIMYYKLSGVRVRNKATRSGAERAGMFAKDESRINSEIRDVQS